MVLSVKAQRARRAARRGGKPVETGGGAAGAVWAVGMTTLGDDPDSGGDD